MGTYVVGDIHGCFNEWMCLKEKIEKEDKDAKFILVGDIIDRGYGVYDMLMWAIENVTDNGKYQMIIGNHEDEKLDWLKSYFEDKEFNIRLSVADMYNDNYDFKDMCINKNLSDQQLQKILEFFQSLPYYKELDVDMGVRKQHYIIVHGGMPFDCFNKNETFKKRSILKGEDAVQNYRVNKRRSEIVWDRTSDYRSLKRTVVVHGHTPTIVEQGIGIVPGSIHFTNNAINVDCGEVYRNDGAERGNLAAIRLEDLKEYYVHDSLLKEHMNMQTNQEMKAEMLLTRREINRRINIRQEKYLKDLGFYDSDFEFDSVDDLFPTGHQQSVNNSSTEQ